MSPRASSRLLWALTSGAPGRAEGGSAGRAHRRRVRDFSRSPQSVDSANALSRRAVCRRAWRSSSRPACRRSRAGRRKDRRPPSGSAARFASLLTPIGVVARRRTRTGRRILARAVGQRTRQLAQPPRQFLKLLARHRRKVGSLDIVQVGDESARHSRRRILFAPVRKPRDRRSNESRTRRHGAAQKLGDVNGYD